MKISSLSDIGLIGLATMGQNLARNIADKGFQISVFNRTTEKTQEFIKEHPHKNLHSTETLKEFCNSLKTPRKIILLVKAGEPVDQMIEQLKPHLDPKDILIDLGNSNYKDTIRRNKQFQNFIGAGVSGGEEGALHGPSLMPGGSTKAYKQIEKIFQKIAAKDFQGQPCVTHLGEGGAGHFVKTIHNGIEYAVMQLIAETYDIYRKIYKLPAPEIAKIFQNYNRGKLKSYLIEITAKVLAKKDDLTSDHLINKILDKAGQKGTGTWTAIESLERAVALDSITSAVLARVTSGEKALRTSLQKLYKKSEPKPIIPLNPAKKIIADALYSAILISYAQGFELIKKAASEENWQINFSEIARIWQGGCIIRADILKILHQAYKKSSKNLPHLFAIKSLKTNPTSLQKLLAQTSLSTVSTPAYSASLNYFKAITSENSPANLIQGLRDFFGAHTYERTDKKGSFHTNW